CQFGYAHRPNTSRLRASSQSSRPSRCAALKCSLRVTLTVGIPLLPAMNPDSGPARIVARDMAQGKTISDKEGGTREEPARAGAGRLNRCTGGNFLEPSRKRLVTSPGAPPSSREA